MTDNLVPYVPPPTLMTVGLLLAVLADLDPSTPVVVSSDHDGDDASMLESAVMIDRSDLPDEPPYLLLTSTWARQTAEEGQSPEPWERIV